MRFQEDRGRDGPERDDDGEDGSDAQKKDHHQHTRTLDVLADSPSLFLFPVCLSHRVFVVLSLSLCVALMGKGGVFMWAGRERGHAYDKNERKKERKRKQIKKKNKEKQSSTLDYNLILFFFLIFFKFS